MTEITSRLSTALADRYKIERHLGAVYEERRFRPPGRSLEFEVFLKAVTVSRSLNGF